jgi:hypothetical protein
MKHIKIFEEFVNEFGGDFTKEYDGFIVLDVKDQKAYKFRYIKGTKGVKAEDAAIAKVMQKTGKPRNAFMVHGSIKKGEFDKTDTHPNFGTTKIEVLESVDAILEGRFTKEKLMKMISKLDDAEVVVKGKTYIIYNPDSGNADNTAMWGNDTVKVLNSDGDEFEFKYSEIDAFNESVNEAKQNIEAFMDTLEKKYGFNFVRPSEEFNGSKGGVWVSGENGETLGGKTIYSYYASGPAYELGVLKKYEDAINKLGWYSEWNDPGTVMIWPI